MNKFPTIQIVSNDVFKEESNCLCIFHAKNVSRLIWSMIDLGIVPSLVGKRIPEDGYSRLVKPTRSIGSPIILFCESSEDNIDYEDINQFGISVIRDLANNYPTVKSISLILHGPGYGLDTEQCFYAMLSGMMSAWEEHKTTLSSLNVVKVVEQMPNRITRLKALLKKVIDTSATIDIQTNEPRSRSVFVAMPFAEDFTDVWEYGIYNPVKDAGYLCERADRAVFTGDIMDWLKNRIQAADLIIADVTTANPNVYLEVGYAWGLGKPTVLISRKAEDLRFDIKSQRCIIYNSIKHLETTLRKELPVHLLSS